MDILMPQLGETVAEGKITTWFKAIGDALKPGDNLFEIETDKVSMEVPATSAGTLTEIRVAAGEVAPVGAVVATVAGAGDARLPPPRAGEGALPLALRLSPASRRPQCPSRSTRSARCGPPSATGARRGSRPARR